MSATRPSSSRGLAFLSLLVFVLAGAIFFEWRASRADGSRQSAEGREALQGVSAAIREQQSAQKLLSSRVGAIADTMRGTQETLRAHGAILERAFSSEAPENGGEPTLEDEPSDPPEEERRFLDVDPEDLPRLPEGFDAEAVLGEEHLADLVRRLRADPDRRLDGLETAKALGILAESKARLDLLRSRIRMTTLEGAEVLRERGDFLEFARGEKYVSEPGEVSFGEDLGEAGTRLFYFFPEEFPELYAMRAERQRVPAIGIRTLLRLINEKER